MASQMQQSVESGFFPAYNKYLLDWEVPILEIFLFLFIKEQSSKDCTVVYCLLKMLHTNVFPLETVRYHNTETPSKLALSSFCKDPSYYLSI